MYEVIGTKEYTPLLSKTDGDVTSVPMESGNGTVARGTVVYRKSTGLWAPAESSNVTAANQLAVLDETVDTSGLHSGSITIAETARAYRAGHFVAGAVKLKAGAAVSAANAVVLRAQGIVFDPMVSDTGFNNSVNG